ncbi:MAG: cell surface protein SprA, partial [Candidatus Neomarinimicrobiota bacterium]
MRILLFLIFLTNISMANDYGNFLPDPFSKKKKINFSYNDISNYPIGIFDLNKNIDETVFIIDRDFSQIQIKSYSIGYHNIFFYQDSFENYISDLFESNQKYNVFKGLNVPSDSTLSKKDTFLQLASIDLGALGKASLKVAGNVNLSAKLVNQDQELVRSSFREQEKTNFKFDQKQQLNVQGKIGDKVTISLDQNSERDFDWENTIRIDYQGEEDDILQRLEVGNISLSLPSTEFVTFSGTNNGLFGVKALSQLGPVNITSIASIEKTEKESQQYKGSSELRTLELKDFNYKKNLYFFVHEWFRNGASQVIESSNFQLNIPSFYPLIDGLHSIGNVSIKNFELYKIDSSNNPQADPGIAYINPSEKNQFSDESKQGNFLKLSRGTDYTINEDLGFIRMKKTLQSEIIAAHFDIVDRDTGNIVTKVGQSLGPSQDSLELIMIKSQSPHPNHPTWDLMFKNVYSLNTSNIDASSLEVQIVDNFSTPKSDRLSSGETFLNLFGLDELNQNGDKSPDEIIDYNNPNIVNIQSGEIMLPSLLPFVSENSIQGGNSNESLEQLLQQGVMYTSTNMTQYTGDSRFSILVRYSSPQQSINLGFTLVEGSEEIFSNGNQLLRGRDYQIDYFSGTITLSENINPNDDLRISYDKHDLVSFDRKVMAGSRAQIDFDENSFLGMTALYYDQSIVNKKVEVGYEPIQNFIWDVNGRYETSFENFSSKINKFSFLNDEKISNFSVEGEFAQVLPNPNSISNSKTGDKNGVAFIDDFEGSKRVTNPSILRRFWNISSAPLDSDTFLDYSQNNRMKMFWYNPYSQVLTNSIWPNVSTSQRAQNITTDVLVLKYGPQGFQSNVDPDLLWGGITSPMFIGDYDQTRSRFFEIWIRGDQGDLTIDLGKISEDYNGDGLLNTEDIPDAGLALGNGFLEDNEDTGLDGCFDDFEDGFGSCLDTSGLTYPQYLENGESILINNSFDVDIQDPNGDNWSYNEGSNDYTKVNGTEGNGTGSKIQTGGKYPDSEDLDKSGYLDRANNYFSKKVSLNESTYVAAETEIDGIKTGWKLLRIPISHFSKINDISLSEIKYVRLVVSGVEEESTLEIAKIELVGNNWQELGTSIQTEDNYSLQDSTFVVSVINDEDNP